MGKIMTMTCVGCKHAEWKKTSAGRLHPSGDGLCRYPIEKNLPPLPAAFYWLSAKPSIGGGYTNRRRLFETDCPYYEKTA